jgi:murein DD-endopeptidase MepM/ murein hydrolase activator NlpD
MADSRFTILIVPNAKSSCRKIKISSRNILYAFIILAAFGSIGVGTILYYLEIYRNAQAVRQENVALKARLQESEVLAQKLNRKISALTRLSARLKAVSGMPTLHARKPAPVSFGMGGVTPHSEKLVTLEKRAEMLEQNLKVLQSYIQTEKPFSKPSLFPTEGFISSSFGGRRNPFSNLPDFHEGIDISGDYGTPILATAQGKVKMAQYYGSFGLAVEIEHENGMTTLFAHLAKILVKPGEEVRRGQKIGLMGNTGMSTGPHLHYEVRVNDQPVNPRPYLVRRAG